ncbi:hypothetical protein AAMO2058_000844000 [Amorphochlora amoebiformis]
MHMNAQRSFVSIQPNRAEQAIPVRWAATREHGKHLLRPKALSRRNQDVMISDASPLKPNEIGQVKLSVCLPLQVQDGNGPTLEPKLIVQGNSVSYHAEYRKLFCATGPVPGGNPVVRVCDGCLSQHPDGLQPTLVSLFARKSRGIKVTEMDKSQYLYPLYTEP